jgi:hypothetical protein
MYGFYQCILFHTSQGNFLEKKQEGNDDPKNNYLYDMEQVIL